MDLFSDLISAVQSDLTVDGTSPLFNPTAIKLAINRAYRKAGALFRWPDTKDAKKTSTEADMEYYDYPDNWRPESIWKLIVDGVDYERPIAYNDYLYEREQNVPSGNDYMWANNGKRYFIYPTPTAAGSFNISVWGVKVVDALVNDADVTIFSYSSPECNDAIVMEAVAILKNKGGDQQSGQFLSAEAKQILATAWSKIRQEQVKNEGTQPAFQIDDMFQNRTSRRGTSRIGNF